MILLTFYKLQFIDCNLAYCENWNLRGRNIYFLLSVRPSVSVRSFAVRSSKPALLLNHCSCEPACARLRRELKHSLQFKKYHQSNQYTQTGKINICSRNIR